MTHAATAHESRPVYRFGRFELHPAERRLPAMRAEQVFELGFSEGA